MKLSFAVALLGQSIPALSTQHDPFVRLIIEIQKAASHQSLNVQHDNERRGLRHKVRMMRHLARNLKNAPRDRKATIPCDPRSTDADVGILSCGKDHSCKPSIASSLGGVCIPIEANRHDQKLAGASIHSTKGTLVNRGTDLVECDPASIDMGILSCGEGRICKQDETSGLGGFCFDTAASNNRRLQANPPAEGYLSLCGPFPDNDYVGFSCDCSGVHMAPGDGTMFCSQNSTAFYIQGCGAYDVYNSLSFSFENSSLVKTNTCYESRIPSVEGICFLYYFDKSEPVCYAEWNDQRCTSCDITNHYVPAFNCSNLDGGRVGDSLSVFGLCANATCTDFCGEGYVIPDYNFGINVPILGYYYTCGELATLYGGNAIVDHVACPYFVAAAQTGGCCVPLNSTSPGGDSPIPDPEPTNNTIDTGTSIPVEGDEDEDTPSPPENDGAYQTVARLASLISQAAVIMVLVKRV